MDFNISRLNTNVGIFRLSGVISDNNIVFFYHADFMSTDGWQEVDIKSEGGSRLLKQVEVDVLKHTLK